MRETVDSSRVGDERTVVRYLVEMKSRKILNMWNVNHGPSWLSRVEFTTLMILFWELEFEMIIKSLKDTLQEANRNEKNRFSFERCSISFINSWECCVSDGHGTRTHDRAQKSHVSHIPFCHLLLFCVRFFFFNDSKFHLISLFFSLLCRSD